MANGDVYETVFVVALGTQTALPRRHYRVAGMAGTGPTQTQIATAIDALIAPLIKPTLVITARYRGSMTARVFPVPRVVTSNITANAGDGIVAGDPLPGQVSGIITLRTLNAGRKYRGRFYVPFPGEADNAPTGVPTGSYQTALDTLGTALVQTIVGVGSGGNTANLEPVLAKFTYANHEVQSVQTFLLDSRIGRPRWATQRRRGNYGAQNVAPI